MRNCLSLLTVAGFSLIACSTSVSPSTTTTSTTTTTTTTTTTPTTTPAAAPAMYKRFQSAVTITIEGTNIVLKSNTTPDHKSPYWGVGNALYEAPTAGVIVNPNLIVSQTLTLKVPMSPAAATVSDTPQGPMGMSVNGVPLFNQYAAGRSPLGAEIISFDRYDGHPQQTGQYHYHLEPYWLTSSNGASSLIGVLLDGFPVYGPKETDGTSPAGLDTCNGHTHATADVPTGLYHYHVSAVAPYISGCFKGTPGSVG